MKKLFYFSMFLMGTVFAFTSCTADDENPEAAKEETVIKSKLTPDVVAATLEDIDALYEQEVQTRSVGGDLAITEEQARETLQPFIEEGERVRQEILADMNANPMDYPIGSGIELMQLEDEHLAKLGLTVYEFYNNPKIVPSAYNKWTNCLGEAFGIGKGLYNYIKGTAKLMTARVAFDIVKAFAKRSLGIVGAAIAAYEYYDCINR